MRRCTWLVCLALLSAGCVMPAKGTPVFVDMRAGKFYSGEGMLHEVNEDETLCRVSVRDRTLYVSKRWVNCRYVHARSVHDVAPPRATR